MTTINTNKHPFDLFDRIIGDFTSDLSQIVDRARRTNLQNINTSGIVSIGRAFPRFNVAVSDAEYEIVAAVPGYTKDNFELEITSEAGIKCLSIKGTKTAANTAGKDFVINEIHQSSFHRSLTLPEDADDSKITSSLQDGLLTIKVPRVPKVKQTISIS